MGFLRSSTWDAFFLTTIFTFEKRFSHFQWLIEFCQREFKIASILILHALLSLFPISHRKGIIEFTSCRTKQRFLSPSFPLRRKCFHVSCKLVKNERNSPIIHCTLGWWWRIKYQRRQRITVPVLCVCSAARGKLQVLSCWLQFTSHGTLVIVRGENEIRAFVGALECISSSNAT